MLRFPLVKASPAFAPIAMLLSPVVVAPPIATLPIPILSLPVVASLPASPPINTDPDIVFAVYPAVLPRKVLKVPLVTA